MERRELLNILQRCGHFIHCRKGKKLGQYRILLILKNRGTLPQKDVQDILHVKSGSISEILGKMEVGRLILRTRDTSDKRKVLVSLTEQGLAYVERLIAEYEKEDEALFDCLNEDECRQLKEILDKLYNSWI